MSNFAFGIKLGYSLHAANQSVNRLQLTVPVASWPERMPFLPPCAEHDSY